MRVACIVDTRGKVQHNRIKILKEILPDISFDVFFCKEKFRLKPSKYDCVYYASCGLYKNHPVSHRCLSCSITSHKCLAQYKQTLKLLRRFHNVSVNNKILYDRFSKNIDGVVYIPNGVNTELFFPKKRDEYRPEKLRVGWVGNTDRETKNFHKIIAPLKMMKGVKVLTIETKKSKRFKKSQEDMATFYNLLDFYIVCSSTEGTPNPALEAASCGVPVVSTAVGNMVDLIRDGDNGFLIKEPNIRKFKSVLNRIKERVDVSKYEEMSLSIRKDIVRNWRWESRASLYKKLFTNAIQKNKDNFC